ncbi:hypothetical protein [Paenibacillus pinihumi]|uniref:hypothetical protein n=1 Tax=Paenibacillus pinihumi TaxID=669462 RepID=UPI00042A39FC|nr:hypothetical protein [Paenibacillus pinihumi]
MNPKLAQLFDKVIQIPRNSVYTASISITSDIVDVVVLKNLAAVDSDEFIPAWVEFFLNLHNEQEKVEEAIQAIDAILSGDYNKEAVNLAG